MLIVRALGKDMNYFYRCNDLDNFEPLAINHQKMCIELLKNFTKILSLEQQEAINMLVRSLSGS